jgi:hypothetical protein
MPIHNQTESLAQKILAESLESTAEETVKSVGEQVLGALLSAAIANPAAAVLAGVAKMLVGTLFEKTSGIEKKMDAMIARPFDTAALTLKEILSVKVTNEGEWREVNRQLEVAFGELRGAEGYAKRLDPGKLTLIRLYQSLVAALMPNGLPFLDLYVRDLRALSIEERRRGFELEVEAASLKSLFDETDILMMAERISEPGAPGALGGMGLEMASVARNKKALTARSEASRRYADELDSFSEFVLTLSRHRSGVLRAEPQ